MRPLIPQDEAERLVEFRLSAAIDSEPEERFDKIARIAQRAFNAPFAGISFVEGDRQWFKSRQGLQIGDSSLGDAWPRGSVLSFIAEVPQPGDVTLLRHRRSKLLALRRLTPPTYAGLQPWQPAYVAGGEWMAVGRLQVVLPRLPPQQ